MGLWRDYVRDVLWRHGVREFLHAARDTQAHLDCVLPKNRYYFLTLRLFSDRNLDLSVRVRSPFVVGPRAYGHDMDQYARMAFSMKGVHFTSKVPSDTASKTLVFDAARKDSGLLPWARRIRLRYDIGSSPPDGDWLVAPYLMHPVRYWTGEDSRLHELRKASRNVRVLFAGNVDAAHYGNGTIRSLCERFGYATRPELFLALMSAPVPLTEIKSADDFEAVARSRAGHGLVVTRSDRYTIPSARWMGATAAADFLLAFPGVVMPLCHNAIEAMAVGTIPILMHDEWFHPRLTHGHNCFHIDRAADLGEILRHVLALPQTAVESMRRNVIEYYEAHLSPSSFIRRVQSHPSNDLTVFLNFERASQLERVTRESVVIAPRVTVA